MFEMLSKRLALQGVFAVPEVVIQASAEGNGRDPSDSGSAFRSYKDTNRLVSAGRPPKTKAILYSL